MHNWLGVALIAYSIGATIEGINAASQLSHSSMETTDRADDHTLQSAEPTQGKWQVVTAIAAVSFCGAFLWPCRLIHRSMKAVQPCRKD